MRELIMSLMLGGLIAALIEQVIQLMVITFKDEEGNNNGRQSKL